MATRSGSSPNCAIQGIPNELIEAATDYFRCMSEKCASPIGREIAEPSGEQIDALLILNKIEREGLGLKPREQEFHKQVELHANPKPSLL